MATLDLPRNSRGLSDSSFEESVSILHSLHQLEPTPNTHTTALSLDRQITSGITIDWKQFDPTSTCKGQLILRDGQHDDRILFTYTVEKEVDGDPRKVTYRWIRTPKLTHPGLQLLQEEHLYTGDMKQRKKNGFGQYSIIRRFTDNSERTQVVKGEWRNDIFIQGVLDDGQGHPRRIKGSVMALRSKIESTPYAASNRTIQLHTQRIEEKKKKTQRLENLKKSSMSMLSPPNSAEFN